MSKMEKRGTPKKLDTHLDQRRFVQSRYEKRIWEGDNDTYRDPSSVLKCRPYEQDCLTINDAAILYELTCRHKNLLITDGLGLDESFNANEGSEQIVLDTYPMKNIPRGYCLLLINAKFTKAELQDLTEVHDIDEGKLRHVFETLLKFKVVVERDKTKEETNDILKKYAEENHDSYDCFVCVCLSHGSLGIMYDIDGKEIRLSEVVDRFNGKNCEGLRGKPKLFFFDMCRVHVKIQKEEGDPAVEEKGYYLNEHFDTLRSWATWEGASSLCDSVKGSWFTDALCDILEQHYKGKDLLQILTMVNAEVDKGNNENMSQCPIQENSFRKKLFFGDTKKSLVLLEPGKPSIDTVNSDSVTIHWTRPTNFKESSYYEVRYKEIGNRRTLYSEIPERETATIGNLKADTTYVFQVRAMIDGYESPYSPESDEVRTKASFAHRLLRFTSKVKDGQPAIYQLHCTENIDARNERAKTRKLEIGNPPIIGREEKTILLVGARGSGKSTLVNGIINYVTGVNWKDPYRFTLVDLEEEKQNKSQAFSQTEWITCYTINPEEGSRLDYGLKIIDTPGFENTRGSVRDQEIVRQIMGLFSAPGAKGVVFIDAVCFLIKAPDARLTPAQKSVLSLFGQDIEKNICTLITFADGDTPPVHAAMTEAELPYDSSYVFNNSGLFASNEESKSSLAPMFWDMGNKCFKRFFDCLEQLPTTSLRQTQRLIVAIQNLQPQVDAGLNKVYQLKQEIDILKKHEKDIKDNKDFEYEVDEVRQVRTELYNQAVEKKPSHEEIIKRMMSDLEELDGAIQEMMEQVNDCNNILKDIALRPNPLTMVEHIDLMIEGEKMEKKHGFQNRIQVLNSYRKRAEMHKDVSKLKEAYKKTAGSSGNENLPGNQTATPHKTGFWKQFERMFTS